MYPIEAVIGWSTETVLALAVRVARRIGAHRDEVYPVVRVRDRTLLGFYVRDRGWMR